MTKPESFISSTDYATLKNDGNGTATLTVPASQTVGSGGVYRIEASVAVGTAGASERAQIHSSVLGQRFVGSVLSVSRTGVAGGSSSPYTILAHLYRSSATTLTAVVEIRNPYGSTLTGFATAETFTFYFSTFIPPLS